jgi:hypothetical protein
MFFTFPYICYTFRFYPFLLGLFSCHTLYFIFALGIFLFTTASIPAVGPPSLLSSDYFAFSFSHVILLFNVSRTRPLMSRDLELSSETMNPFRHIDRTGVRSIAKPLTYTGQHNTQKRGHISMPRAGFEPVIPVLE